MPKAPASPIGRGEQRFRPGLDGFAAEQHEGKQDQTV